MIHRLLRPALLALVLTGCTAPQFGFDAAGFTVPFTALPMAPAAELAAFPAADAADCAALFAALPALLLPQATIPQSVMLKNMRSAIARILVEPPIHI